MNYHPIVYDEWNPRDYKASRWERLIAWLCEKLTGMKVIALYKRKGTKVGKIKYFLFV